MNSKYLFIFLVCLCFTCKNNTATEVTQKAPISVHAIQVKEQDLKEYLTFNGVTQYLKTENIRSNVTGYISQMNFKIGDAVKKGQSFAYVRTKEQDALAEAMKIDSSLAKFSSPLRVTCNSSGIISVLNVQKNDYVAEGDLLATISQPSSLVIQVNVPYEYEDFIKIGTLCNVQLQNDKIITAKISGSLPIIDAVAQSQTFLIALPNQDLPENLNVIVKTIYREAPKSMSIPHDALQTNELMTDYWVMKIIDNKLAIKTAVSPLLRNDTLVQIKSENIKLNDWIVTEGSYQMQDSTLVTIRKQ
jgi:multidrug efflux pump subunit AcrA (membrane-fusion protein)